jgi:hypothetical protein
MNARQVQGREWSDERFRGHETDMCRNLAQMVGTEHVTVVLDTDSHPDVRRPVDLLRDGPQSARSLGQNLIGVLRANSHDIEHTANELQWDVIVEQVTHRIHEDPPRGSPMERCIKG